MAMSLSQVAGVLPAVVFPAATALQLLQIVRRRSAAGVSVTTWLLFGFANVGLYFYTERYTEWQSIVGMLLTALLDFVIVALAWRDRRPTDNEDRVHAVDSAAAGRAVLSSLRAQALREGRSRTTRPARESQTKVG